MKHATLTDERNAQEMESYIEAITGRRIWRTVAEGDAQRALVKAAKDEKRRDTLRHYQQVEAEARANGNKP